MNITINENVRLELIAEKHATAEFVNNEFFDLFLYSMLKDEWNTSDC
jgi:RimJ/RimL family protein N-acetyltransferase